MFYVPQTPVKFYVGPQYIKLMVAEPPGLEQGLETSGLGLHGNQKLSGNTVGSPEHNALWGPGSAWAVRPLREEQLHVSHSTH